MCERLPGYDDWKLDNGPYENDGEPYDPVIGDYLAEEEAARDEEPAGD